jgi:hypothetical protein
MNLLKVNEILNEFVQRKFNGSLNIDFKKGEPFSISKAQKVFFDPYLPRPAYERALEKPAKESTEGDQLSQERSGKS